MIVMNLTAENWHVFLLFEKELSIHISDETENSGVFILKKRKKIAKPGFEPGSKRTLKNFVMKFKSSVFEICGA